MFVYNIRIKCTQVSAENAKVYDTVTFEGPPLMKQRLWPRHCVQDSWGAELHKDLKVSGWALYKFLSLFQLKIIN